MNHRFALHQANLPDAARTDSLENSHDHPES